MHYKSLVNWKALINSQKKSYVSHLTIQSMYSFEFRICCFGLFLCVVSCLRNCGEFDKDETIGEILKEYSKPLPYRTILNHIFYAFDENDTQRMEEMFKLLKRTKVKDLDDSESETFVEDSDPLDYSEERIKFVVGFL